MRLQRHSNGERFSVYPDSLLGEGGEARIFSVPPDDRFVVKIYRRPTPERERKLLAMLANPPEDPLASGYHTSIAWPLDLVSTVYNGVHFMGYLMPRVTSMRPLFSAYNPATRRSQTPFFNYQYLHRAGRNFVSAVRALHNKGYVIGDVNESNVLVSETALVTLVDTDSFQVSDLLTGKNHRCLVGKPEYTPPEIQGRRYANIDRNPEHDHFGLATLLFQLLLEGTHPFAGIYQGGGDPPPYERRIVQGHFAFGSKAVPYALPDIAPPLETLHPLLRQLFLRCFEDGHTRPDLRPDAQTWLNALAEAENELVSCDRNPQHWHGRHLKSCPWCARTELLEGRDPFPHQAKTETAPPNRVLAQTLIPKTEPLTIKKPPAQPRVATPAKSYSHQTISSNASWQLNAPLSASVNGGIPGNAPAAPTKMPAPANVSAWCAFGWALMAAAAGGLGLRAFDYFLVSLTILFGLIGIARVKVNGNKGKATSLFSIALASVSLVPTIYSEITSNDKNVLAATTGGVLTLAFSPDGKTLASGTARIEDQSIIGGMIDLWDVKGQGMRGLLDEKRGDIISIAYSPGGESLIMGHDTPLGESEVFLMSANVRGNFHLLGSERTHVNQVAFSPDGVQVAAAYEDKRVAVWDVKSLLPVKTLYLSGPARAISFSANDRYLAVGIGSSSGSVLNSAVVLWERNPWKEMWIRPAHGKGVRCVIFPPNSGALVSGGSDGRIDFRDVVTGNLTRSIDGQGFWVQALAFSKDGKRMASGALKDDISEKANETTLWESASLKPIRRFYGHFNRISSVAFSPDGTILATGSRDGSIRLWKVR